MTGSWGTVTVKRREDELVISLYEASPAGVILPCACAERTPRGRRVVRREALRCIPGSAGKDWRDVLGSDVLPGAERLRGQEHDRKPAAGSRYQGRRAGGPARYGES